jgi:hypothetical protein
MKKIIVTPPARGIPGGFCGQCRLRNGRRDCLNFRSRLVFGVAATTNHSSTVLVAGASGAVSAAVSITAGAYLDAETSRDEAQSSATLIDSQMQRNAVEVLEGVMDRIRTVGLGPDQAKRLTSFLRTGLRAHSLLRRYPV